MKTDYLSRAEIEREIEKLSDLEGVAFKRRVEELDGSTFIDEANGGQEVVAKIVVEEKFDPANIKAIKTAVSELAKPNEEARRKVLSAMFGSKGNNMTSNTSIEHVHNTSALKAFKGPDGAEKAYRFGQWAAACLGKSTAKQWCQDNGIIVKTGAVEGTDSLGGYLVPDVLSADLIRLVNEYGTFRRNAYNVPMTSDVVRRPRRTGGLTAYFTGESQTATSSNATWDQTVLTARKLTVLSKMSSEVSEDAITSIGDLLAFEIALAFAYKEDLCGWNGDGTSTYGGINGVINRLSGVNGVDDGGGLVLGAGNAYSELTLANFHTLVSRVPSYARMGSKFYASPVFYDSVMQKLAFAAGGVTAAEVVAGSQSRSFLGYPVELVEVLPTAEANSQICCLFGNLSKAADFGDRRATTIAYSTSGYVDGTEVFASDEILIKGTERFDINVHDVGDSTTAGPIVGLITQAS